MHGNVLPLKELMKKGKNPGSVNELNFFYEYFNAELTKPKIIIILTFNSYETIK